MSDHKIFKEANEIGIDLMTASSGEKIIIPSKSDLEKYKLTEKQWLAKRRGFVRKLKKLRDGGEIPAKPKRKKNYYDLNHESEQIMEIVKKKDDEIDDLKIEIKDMKENNNSET